MNQREAAEDSIHESRQRQEAEAKDPIAARKVQKADRERLRRDRLNEQFLELGHTLDPERPKNDKATILTDTIQILKDLTSEVDRLKTECASLSEESRELMQEKNELREEKASLKSDVENLNIQYQQRLRVIFPWGPVDPSVVMGPAYSYAVPVPVPPGPMPMHPQMQPFPFFRNQPPNAVHGTCSTFMPYPTPPNPPIEQPSAQSAAASHASSKPDPKSKAVRHQAGSHTESCDDSADVATELVLKMPGSSSQQVERKRKQLQRKEKDASCVVSSSSMSSSPLTIYDNSSNSVNDAASSKP
ncbi:Transcription factor bHLH121 [Linum perenne]